MDCEKAVGLMGWRAQKQVKNWLQEVLKYVGRPDWLEGGQSESRLLEAS